MVAMTKKRGTDMMAQGYFTRKGSGEPMTWKGAFSRSYEDGFKKTHHAP